jgi:hypothetical protein
VVEEDGSAEYTVRYSLSGNTLAILNADDLEFEGTYRRN